MRLPTFSHRRLLWTLLILAFILRAGFGLSRQDLGTSTDERHWDGQARSFWLSGLLHPDGKPYRPPLYPLLLAGVYKIHGHTPTAARLWQALLGTATCLLLYASGRHLGCPAVGLVAAALAALYPLFIFFSGILMSETLLIFLTTAVLWAALRWAAAPTTTGAIGLGLLLGLAALCKAVILAWLPLLLWVMARHPRLPFRSGLAHATLSTLAAIVLIAPWTWRNAVIENRFIPISSNAGINLFIGHEPNATGVYREGTDYRLLFAEFTSAAPHPVDKDRLGVRLVLQGCLADPGRCLGLALRKTLHFWNPLAPGESVLRQTVALLSCGPVLLLGLWGLSRLWHQDAFWLIASLGIALTAVHALFFAHIRFRLPLDAALMLPAALVLVESWRARPGAGP
ncbi:MAG: phospholipid carrier-dependent glycosyltransferase [Candidatus Latescibacteria bacterium]|nr:phospholipid carrier-dependent glycosyltransferase [Candidatus Latescibacterota bacterium]